MADGKLSSIMEEAEAAWLLISPILKAAYKGGKQLNIGKGFSTAIAQVASASGTVRCPDEDMFTLFLVAQVLTGDASKIVHSLGYDFTGAARDAQMSDAMIKYGWSAYSLKQSLYAAVNGMEADKEKLKRYSDLADAFSLLADAL